METSATKCSDLAPATLAIREPTRFAVVTSCMLECIWSDHAREALIHISFDMVYSRRAIPDCTHSETEALSALAANNAFHCIIVAHPHTDLLQWKREEP
jgi:hypothetical protein